MARRRRQRSNGIDPVVIAIIAIVVAVIAWVIISRGLKLAPVKRTFTMEQARSFNASIPFVTARSQPAAPFHFHGTPAAREQAAQCLATAALYEAGADELGQKAVIQIVLNRVRLPQYPHTICGVIYQGATLATGCQFSFTCDGSQIRRPEHRGWETARAAAKRALGGYVLRSVGRATHYHADWMVPYWVTSLDKIAQIRTHIFYRPRGPANTEAAAK